jgi:hypothetical protein
VAERAADPVKTPDNRHVAVAAGFQRARQAKRLRPVPVNPVLEDFRTAGALQRRPQGIFKDRTTGSRAPGEGIAPGAAD